MSPALNVQRTGPGGTVARVTLARPGTHNAFDATLIAELRAVFVGLARESPTELRVVVLGGEGPSFCAGADIGWMRAAATLAVEANEQDAMAMADMFESIDTCPVPVIARVHGAALGGGVGLVRGRRRGHRRERDAVRLSETRLGILPAVISPFVVAKIGESEARALFPGGRRFDAIRAQRIGPRPRGRGRARRPSTPRSRWRFATSSRPDRPPPARPRRSSARSAVLGTAPPSGTRRGPSPGSA